MRAAGFEEFGAANVLRVVERPVPVAGPGDVVVRVAASTVNPTDVLMRSGKQAAMMGGLSPPFVAGNEFSGTVHAIGDGVTGFAVGMPVMGAVNPRRPEGGSHAEYVRVPATALVAVPAGADLIQAATLPMNGLTALLVMDALHEPELRSLLVTGGAGALGGYVIELARRRGLHVVADGNEADVYLLRKLGAEHVVARGAGMEAGVRRIYPSGVDAAVDCALLRDRAAALVRDGGVVVCVRRNIRLADTRVTSRAISVTDQPVDPNSLQQVAQLWAAGALTARVARVLPLEQAAEAHQLVEAGGMRGRVVLVTGWQGGAA